MRKTDTYIKWYFIIQKSINEVEILADDSEYESILREPNELIESAAAEPLSDYGKKLLKNVEFCT